jgi:hypothetical protein
MRQFVEFRLPSGQGFGVFGLRAEEYQCYSCPVIGFDVEDVYSVKRALEARALSSSVRYSRQQNGEAWTYFRGPGGHIFETWQGIFMMLYCRRTNTPPPDVPA